MRTLFERLPRLVIAILLLVLSVFLLTLYFTQKGHPEYLWLALHELVQVPIGIIDQASSSALSRQHFGTGGLYLQLVFISAYLYFEFLVAFLALQAPLVHQGSALYRTDSGVHRSNDSACRP